MNSESIFIYTAVADELTATSLAELIVGENLAACVQIVPGVKSVYRWQGRIKRDDEMQLVIKTTDARFDAVAALLREHHPYELPEIVAVPIVRGSEAYLDWIESETSGEGGSWQME
jgi:periplasmic divalent cation tolerance protein